MGKKKKKKSDSGVVPFLLGSVAGLAIYHLVLYPKRFVQDYNARNWSGRIEKY